MRPSTSSLPKSAEILRTALPLMARYRIPVTPRNYAIWYEYAAGSNQLLTERLNELIKSGNPVNDELLASLYSEFIDTGYDLNQLEKAQRIIVELQQCLGMALDTAYGSTSRYGASLDQFRQRITADPDIEQLDLLIRDMAGSTESMLDSNRQLAGELDAARLEAAELRRQLQEVRQQAKTDVLTELPNRKALFDQLEEMERSGAFNQGRHSLFMLDIDHFKRINDKYGHLLGDKVIRNVAQVLKQQTKGKDFPARIGGEEFLVLLPDTPLDGALAVAAAVRRSVEQTRIINPRSQQVIRTVTVSIGVTSVEPGDDLDTVLHRADRALYLAKDRGRNCIVDARELGDDQPPHDPELLQHA
jgi:diguanylate cyclase